LETTSLVTEGVMKTHVISARLQAGFFQKRPWWNAQKRSQFFGYVPSRNNTDQSLKVSVLDRAYDFAVFCGDFSGLGIRRTRYH